MLIQDESAAGLALLLCWATSRQRLDSLQAMAWRAHMNVVRASLTAIAMVGRVWHLSALHPLFSASFFPRSKRVTLSHMLVVSMPLGWRVPAGKESTTLQHFGDE